MADAGAADEARNPAAAFCTWGMQVSQRTHAGTRMRHVGGAPPCACKLDACAAAEASARARGGRRWRAPAQLVQAASVDCRPGNDIRRLQRRGAHGSMGSARIRLGRLACKLLARGCGRRLQRAHAGTDQRRAWGGL